VASQKTKLTVGLFVAFGIGIALIAFIWLGVSRFFEKGRYYAVYFNESVQGLDKDSPVKYRGVSIGRVADIGVAPDARLVQVVLKIESGQSLADDIVAQLKAVGITGSMFVELDRKQKEERDLSPPLSFPSEFPIVASKPSDISRLLKGVGDVLDQIKSLDLEGISHKMKSILDHIDVVVTGLDREGLTAKLKKTLDNVNQAIADAEVKSVSKNLQASLGSVNRVLADQRLGSILDDLEQASKALHTVMTKAETLMDTGSLSLERIQGILEDKQESIKATFENFSKATENANLFFEKGTLLAEHADDSVDHLTRHLVVTGQNLERASESLNRLIELVTDHPPQLLFGKPPLPRKVEPLSTD
jgi:phospholipid/cholesterol/gamma-HCH transport system substrate-binding protein